MSQSKVKNVTFSRAWQRDENTTVFYFDIEFEDGTKGQFGTVKREQDKFPVGEAVEYIIKGQNKMGANIIDKVKKRPENRSTYNDPETNRKIAMNVAISAAVKTAIHLEMEKLTENDVISIADFYYGWITTEDSNRDIMSLRWNLVMSVVEAMGILDITSSRGVIETVEVFYKHVSNVKPVA